MDDVEIVPVSVGRTARLWDEQHLDLMAASRQVAVAPVDGFTPGLAGSVAGWCASWARILTASATACEAEAEGLRAALAAFVLTDEGSAERLAALSWLQEVR